MSYLIYTKILYYDQAITQPFSVLFLFVFRVWLRTQTHGEARTVSHGYRCCYAFSVHVHTLEQLTLSLDERIITRGYLEWLRGVARRHASVLAVHAYSVSLLGLLSPTCLWFILTTENNFADMGSRCKSICVRVIYPFYELFYVHHNPYNICFVKRNLATPLTISFKLFYGNRSKLAHRTNSGKGCQVLECARPLLGSFNFRSKSTKHT